MDKEQLVEKLIEKWSKDSQLSTGVPFRRMATEAADIFFGDNNLDDGNCVVGGVKIPSHLISKLDRQLPPNKIWHNLDEETKYLFKLLCLHHNRLKEANLSVTNNEVFSMDKEDRKKHIQKIRDFLEIKDFIKDTI